MAKSNPFFKEKIIQEEGNWNYLDLSKLQKILKKKQIEDVVTLPF
jgi:hypothetical protein